MLPLSNDSGAILHMIGASMFAATSSHRDGPITRDSMIDTFTALLEPALASVQGRPS